MFIDNIGVIFVRLVLECYSKGKSFFYGCFCWIYYCCLLFIDNLISFSLWVGIVLGNVFVVVLNLFVGE